MSTVDSEAVQFFYDNAGFSYTPGSQTEEEGHQESARRLAEAEMRVRWPDYYHTVTPDSEPYDGTVPYDGPVWVVELWKACEGLVASMGGVAVDSEHDPYIRVVVAEMALEHITQEVAK